MLFIYYYYQTLSLVKVCFSSWFWLTLISCSLFSLFVCFLVITTVLWDLLGSWTVSNMSKMHISMLWAAGEKKQALPAVQFSFYFFRSHVRVLHAQTIMRAQICHLSPVSREEGNWSNVKVKEWSRVCFKEKMLNKHSIFPLNSVEGHVLDCFFTVWVYWWEELFFLMLVYNNQEA